MNIYTIYKATCINTGKSYIGFDSHWPKRKLEHKSICDGRNGNIAKLATVKPERNSLESRPWERWFTSEINLTCLSFSLSSKAFNYFSFS